MKKIYTMLFSLMFALSLFSTGCMQTKEESNTIRIGALVPLTGALSSMGEGIHTALQLGVENANTYFPEIGSDIKVELTVKDTDGSNEAALAKLKELETAGIKVVIGPVSSTVLKAIKPYADENGIILVSPASSAPSLAIENDNVLRFVIDDSNQAEAVASMMKQEGIKSVISIVRDDVWGNDLYDATKAKAALSGIKDIEKLSYDASTADFSEYIQSVAKKAESSGDSVAIHLIAFEDDGIKMLREASKYGSLANAKWYGNDVLANNPKLLADKDAAEFAFKTGMVNPIIGEEEETAGFKTIESQIESRIGRRPDAYAIAAYDTYWVIVNAYTDRPDNVNLKKAITTNAEYYYGAMGWATLNEAGDKKLGDYDFWQVSKDSSSYSWEITARYQLDAGHEGRLFILK